MTKFQVLGVTLTDMSVRDSMRKVETYLYDGKVSAICYLTAGGLLEAESHPETKAFLEDMDLTIPADTDVLQAAGISAKQRHKEVEGNDFLRAFLTRVIRDGAPVLILSDTVENAGQIKEGLQGVQKGLNIIGTFALEQISDEDGMINDINSLAPAVIISSLDYPERETFFATHHMKLHAEVWLMLQKSMVLKSSHSGLLDLMKTFIDGRILKKSVSHYKSEDMPIPDEESGEEEDPEAAQAEATKQLLKLDTQELDTEAIRKALEK